MEKKYIVRAIDYVNAKPHIGHAMEYVEADVFARYYKSQGCEVRLNVGVDEHGQKIWMTAREAGKTPQEYCDFYAEKFKDLASLLNIDYDYFIRTTEEKHKRIVQEAWKKVMAKGDIYKKEYEGLYCVGCETFKQEKDLEEGKCPIHKVEPQVVREENYFFKLSQYNQEILNWLSKNPEVVFPEARYNEIYNVVKDGLQDISVSRAKSSLEWGVPVPGDDEQVMYVWFDALLNYITGINYLEDNALFEKWWNDAEVMQILGKDIIRHHVAIWPGILLALGLKLPDMYFVHGFITSGGVKMSKSLGNIIDPLDLIDQYGVDAVRWFLIKEIPAGKDGDITHDRFNEVYESDLANTLGNLFRRVMMLINKYELDEYDGEAFDADLPRYEQLFIKAMENYKLHDACEVILDVLQEGNQYIDEEAPWKSIKDDQDEAGECLWSLVRLLEWVAKKLEIFMPDTAEKMQSSLKNLELGEVLFPKIED